MHKRAVFLSVATAAAAVALACGKTSGNATSELADAGLEADSGLPPGACHLDEDCFLDFGGEGSCLFATGAACGTYGTCTVVAPVDTDVDTCETTACGCDGTPRLQPCGLPAGFTRGNVVHLGPCEDGSVPCDPDAAAACPGGATCGYLVADACDASARCFDGVDPTLPHDMLEEDFCGCDGQMVDVRIGDVTFPGLFAVAPSPVRAGGNAQCLPDAGVLDAGTDAD